jgi:cytochrome c biogenesis protein CcdA
MATEESPSGGNLGTVLETYGGKSLGRILAVGAAVFGCGLTGALLVRWFWPDYRALAVVLFGVGVVIALGFVSTTWQAALAKVEVCERGVRLLRRNGATTELPWDRILQVQVGELTKVRGGPVEHVVIRTTDGKDIELPFRFWGVVGTERFATRVRRFVADVEEDVDLGRPSDRPAMPGAQEPVFGVWFGAVWPPCFLGIIVGITFALRADGPGWEIWMFRAVVTLFAWLMSTLAAGFSFRELRRRGEWLPPVAIRRPWLAAAVSAAGVLLISTVVIVGFVALIELLVGTQGGAHGGS